MAHVGGVDARGYPPLAEVEVEFLEGDALRSQRAVIRMRGKVKRLLLLFGRGIGCTLEQSPDFINASPKSGSTVVEVKKRFDGKVLLCEEEGSGKVGPAQNARIVQRCSDAPIPWL